MLSSVKIHKGYASSHEITNDFFLFNGVLNKLKHLRLHKNYSRLTMELTSKYEIFNISNQNRPYKQIVLDLFFPLFYGKFCLLKHPTCILLHKKFPYSAKQTVIC